MENSSFSCVIVGANFAGLSAAAELAGESGVLVIDPNPWFEFLPNIHELISRHKHPADLRISKSQLMEKWGHCLIQDRVVEFLPKQNRLILSSGREIDYEQCLITIGGVNNDGAVPGADRYAYPFKSVDECAKIGARLFELYQQEEAFSVVIVGGGVEGIEALGEMLRAYRHAKGTIHLVERNAGFTLDQATKLGDEIRRLCSDAPVAFHFGVGVAEVKEQAVVLESGESIDADITIWTGGVKVNPLLQDAGLLNQEDRWAPVNKYLQSPFYPNIWIAGDSVEVPGAHEKQGYYALEMGEVAAKNIKRTQDSHRMLTYRPKSLPSIYSFGDLSCFVVWKQWALAGLPLAALKESVYQYNMAMMEQPGSWTEAAALGGRSLKGAWDIGHTFLRTPLSFIQRASVKLL